MRPSDSPEMDEAAMAEHDRAEFAHSALENLFDVSPDAIFVTDAQGVIRGANPRAAELFGHTPGRVLRACPLRIWFPRASADAIPAIAKTTMRIPGHARWARP